MLPSFNSTVICCFVIFRMFSFTLVSLAANLDDLVIEKPTIRSEITRGVQSIHSCQKKLPVDQMQLYKDCIDEILSTAARNGSSTLPFQLGIHYSGFIDLAAVYKVLMTVGSATKLQHGLTNLQFHEYQALLKQVGISTENLCEATKTNCQYVNEIMNTWKDNP